MTREQAEAEIDATHGRLLWCANLLSYPIAWYTSNDGHLVPITMHNEVACLIQHIRNLRRSYVYPWVKET